MKVYREWKWLRWFDDWQYGMWRRGGWRYGLWLLAIGTISGIAVVAILIVVPV